MKLSDLTHDDALAHMTLAHNLGYGVFPWVTLDDETRKLAHNLLSIDPIAEEGRKWLREDPASFKRWLDREEEAIKNAEA